LAENEDDTRIRWIYADWLDERGEHEEADRQRKWPMAKEWLVQFWQKHCSPREGKLDYEEPDENPYAYFHISYETLLKLGRRAVDEADDDGICFYCGANEEMKEHLLASGQEFWKNWSIVTGIPLPPSVEKNRYFTCSC